MEVVSWFADYTNEWGDYIFRKDIKQIPECLKLIKRGFIITIITIIISLILAIGVPTSKTITKMLVASIITVENVESAKEDTKELVDYICEKISEVKK